MKNRTIILIIAASLAFFAALVFIGLRYRRGAPITASEEARAVLTVSREDKEIDLSLGIDLDLWRQKDALRVDLTYQVMVLPWPQKVVPYVDVKAFHNQGNIYFYLEWLDDTEDATADLSTFPDACAVMFSLDKESQTPTLLMGFIGRANIPVRTESTGCRRAPLPLPRSIPISITPLRRRSCLSFPRRRQPPAQTILSP
jgi:hypothetical protein